MASVAWVFADKQMRQRATAAERLARGGAEGASLRARRRLGNVGLADFFVVL